MTNEVKWICDSCKTSGMTSDEFERHNCGDVVMQLRADLARLRELLNQSLVIMMFLFTLDIKEYQDELNKATAFKGDYAELISRIQSELKE